MRVWEVSGTGCGISLEISTTAESLTDIALRLMTWTNNFSKTFLIFASLIPFFRLIIPEKCFYQWILCHNFVYMKKFPWFLSFELGARQACDRRHRTMGTVHSGKISHLTWTFTKKYWAVLGCTGLYWAVLGHLRYLLGNVQVKWRILPLCSVAHITLPHYRLHAGCSVRSLL